MINIIGCYSESCVPLGTYRQQSLSLLADDRAGPFPTHQGLIEGVLLEFEKIIIP